MTDEEYGGIGIVRSTEAPSRAIKGSNPKKARYTQLSIAGLRANIADGYIKDKIDKYNSEFEKLKELASEVNDSRKDIEDNVDGSYNDVVDGIKKYNAQAKKLAKLGVQILIFDEEIQKIMLDSESAVKAIRVPGFLIGPLKMLTKAGREKARREKEAKLEKRDMEEQIIKTIVDTAQEAIGQEADDSIDVDKLLSLEAKVVEDIKKEGEITPPTVDVEEPKVDVPKIEKVVINDELFKEAKAKWEKSGILEFSKVLHDKLQKINKSESELAALEVLGRYTNADRIYVTKAGDDLLMEYRHPNQKPTSIDAIMFADALGLENKEDQEELFKNFTDLCLMRDAWEKAASKGFDKPTKVGGLACELGVYDKDREVVFNYAISSVRNGKTIDEIVANVPSEFDDEQRKVLKSFVEKEEILFNGVKALDIFVAVRTNSYENVPTEKDTIDMFTLLKNVNNNFGVGLVPFEDRVINVLYSKEDDGKFANRPIKPVELLQMMGKTDVSEEEMIKIYSSHIRLTQLADVWSKVAKDADKENGFDVSKKPMFSFIVESIKNGIPGEEIISQAKDKFSGNDLVVVNTMVNKHYDLVKEVCLFDDKDITKNGDDLMNAEKSVIKDAIANLVEKKYGKIKNSVEQPEKPSEEHPEKPSEEQPEKNSQDNPEEEKNRKEDPNEELNVGNGEPILKQTPDFIEKTEEPISDEIIVGDVDRCIEEIRKSVDRISKIVKSRNELTNILGAESASVGTDAMKELIDSELDGIKNIILERIVSLGQKLEEEQVAKEEENPVQEPEFSEDKTNDTNEVSLEEENPVQESEFNEDKTNDTNEVSLEEENPVQESEFSEDKTNDTNEVSLEEENPVQESEFNEDKTNDTNEVSLEEENPVQESEFSEDKTNDTNEVSLEEENPVQESEFNEDISVAQGVDDSVDLEDPYINWWREVAPLLDDPNQQLLTNMQLAQIERDNVAQKADRDFEKKQWEKARDELVAADKERRAALEADPERQTRRARSILDAYGLQDSDVSFLDDVKNNNPDLYDTMYQNYLDVKRAELKELSESLNNGDMSSSKK